MNHQVTKFNNNDTWHMDIALKEAEKAFSASEVPVGAVIVNKENKIISKSHNLKESSHDPCGHAEIIAIRDAAREIGNWRLSGCKLIVTLEPCVMCMGAIIQARLDTLIFGAYDLKAGAISLGFNLNRDLRLNHRFNIIGGVEHFMCSRMLSSFFKQRRLFYKK